MDQIEMSNPYKGATIDAFYQVSCYLALSGFRGKAVLEIDPSETIITYCLLTDQTGISNSYREPSIDTSYHVSVHLAKLNQ
jgi:hypothetical protein